MIEVFGLRFLPSRRHFGPAWPAAVILLGATVLGTGCSVRSMAVNALAETLAEGADVYASDNDPDLVRTALPFNLKTIETLLQASPEHPGLLLTACSTFTQYAAAFVQPEAEAAEWADFDYAAADALTIRARNLYVRARDYCLRRVELDAPGVADRLRQDPEAAVQVFGPEHVDVMYWLGGSWGLAISAGLDQPALAADLPVVRALLGRALKLQGEYNRGALHGAFITLESVPELLGGSPDRAREHFRQAVALSEGLDASPYVALATGVALAAGDREEFASLLASALAIDPDADIGLRLLNIVSQRRARILLDNIDELFGPAGEPG